MEVFECGVFLILFLNLLVMSLFNADIVYLCVFFLLDAFC